jgi:hypothetical protein
MKYKPSGNWQKIEGIFGSLGLGALPLKPPPLGVVAYFYGGFLFINK